MKRRAAIFLDRDGVLNADSGYVHKVEDLVILPGVPAALTTLADAGFRLVVISNQSGVARGLFPESAVTRFNAALADGILAAGGPSLDAFYYCPHLADGKVPDYARDCDCRKPAPGMVLRAVRDLDLDLAGSWFVGDKPDDVACALAAGIPGIQVTTTGKMAHPQAAAVVTGLPAAAAAILNKGKKG